MKLLIMKKDFKEKRMKERAKSFNGKEEIIETKDFVKLTITKRLILTNRTINPRRMNKD